MSGERFSPFQKKHNTDEGGIESWLMSYADMITLLLCFFIIFVSTSEPKQDKLAAATRGMQARFGAVDLATPFTGAFRALQGIIDHNAAYQDMSVEKLQRGVQIELATAAFYKKDSAEFAPAREQILRDMVLALKDSEFEDYNVLIDGHTDDVPVSSGLYPTNWELSSARATRMVRFFIDNGFDPIRLNAAAYADTRPKVPNTDASGNPIPENRNRNARVVIKLERLL
jgi:chemotaxis protein MotB